MISSFIDKNIVFKKCRSIQYHKRLFRDWPEDSRSHRLRPLRLSTWSRRPKVDKGWERGEWMPGARDFLCSRLSFLESPLALSFRSVFCISTLHAIRFIQKGTLVGRWMRTVTPHGPDSWRPCFSFSYVHVQHPNFTFMWDQMEARKLVRTLTNSQSHISLHCKNAWPVAHASAS